MRWSFSSPGGIRVHRQCKCKKMAITNHMKFVFRFRENPEIVKKNIKQFLDNNRILLKEIAVEIGIEENSIRLYIDGKEAFTNEQREEFYRWYLLKILRPPSGIGMKQFCNFSRKASPVKNINFRI